MVAVTRPIVPSRASRNPTRLVVIVIGAGRSWRAHDKGFAHVPVASPVKEPTIRVPRPITIATASARAVRIVMCTAREPPEVLSGSVTKMSVMAEAVDGALRIAVWSDYI